MRRHGPRTPGDGRGDPSRKLTRSESGLIPESGTGDNHHHLICRTCNRTVDVDCAVGYAPCLEAADDAGFEIDEVEVIYWGRCPECVAAAEGNGVREQ